MLPEWVAKNEEEEEKGAEIWARALPRSDASGCHSHSHAGHKD